MKENGVEISLGDDSITDHRSPFGKGDSLEKAGTLAERFGLSDEQSLGQTLGFITGGVTPLNKKGERIWPNVGDDADLVFVDASCSAEPCDLQNVILLKFRRVDIYHHEVIHII